MKNINIFSSAFVNCLNSTDFLSSCVYFWLYLSIMQIPGMQPSIIHNKYVSPEPSADSLNGVLFWTHDFMRMCMCLNVLKYVCLQEASGERKVKRFPGIGVTEGCKQPCGCCELNLSPLKEQSVLRTTKPSLKTFSYFLSQFLSFNFISF